MIHDRTIGDLEALGHCNKYSAGTSLLPIIAALDDQVSVIIVEESRQHVLDATDSEADNVHAISTEERHKDTVLVEFEVNFTLSGCQPRTPQPYKTEPAAEVRGFANLVVAPSRILTLCRVYLASERI